MDRTTAPPGVPRKYGGAVSHLRSRREVWRRSARFAKLLRNFSRADELPEHLAKRSRRTLGSKHPQRTTRPCDRAQRKPPAALGTRLPPLLSSGSYSRRIK